MGGNDHQISIKFKDQYVSLARSITKNELENVRPRSTSTCIYRVPARLRRANEAGYTPRVVSIGPMHYQKSLPNIKQYKRQFLKYFLERTNKDLIHYVRIVKENEENLRDCYEETLEFSSDEFCHIILVDAIFIVELFFSNYPVQTTEDYPQPDDVINRSSLARHVLGEIFPDLLLLENQLPFFVLKEIWKDATTKSMVKFFNWYYRSGLNLEENEGTNKDPVHFVDMVRNLYIPRSRWGISYKRVTLQAPNAKELHQVGIQFQLNASKNLFDISFRNGVLKMPKLTIIDSTESRMRNLAAFEQCHYEHNESFICHYLIMLYYLVNTHEDVDLLVKNQILENWIGDSKNVSAMINKLCVGVITGTKYFYFGDVFEELNRHYRTPWNLWKVNLKQNYFKTPSAFISFSAATALLVLTVIQTIAAVIPPFKKNNC